MSFGYLCNFSRLSLLLFLVLSVVACSGGDGGLAGVEGADGTGGTVGTVDTVDTVGNAPALRWVAPSERADNSGLSLSEIAGYRIYYGVDTGDYSEQILIDDPTATENVFARIPSGKYFVVMTTIDTEGRESAYSSPELEVYF